MKSDRSCTKCSGTEFVTAHRPHRSMFLGFFRSVNLLAVICAECGFLEEYVEPVHVERLQRFGKRFQKD